MTDPKNPLQLSFNSNKGFQFKSDADVYEPKLKYFFMRVYKIISIIRVLKH